MRHALVIFLILCSSPIGIAQTYPGNVTGMSREGKSITVHAGDASVRFMFYQPEIVRIDYVPFANSQPDSSFVVVQDTSADVPVTVSEDDSTIRIADQSLQITIGKTPLRMQFADGSGNELTREPAEGGLANLNLQRSLTLSIGSNDHFYGTGERGTALDKRGQSLFSYNTQDGGYSDSVQTMGVNVPLILSSAGYAVYIDNTWPGNFNFGSVNPSALTYTAGGGELTVYFIAAPTIARQLERYTWLTGRQPLPPRWALGYIQSKYGYHNETEARAAVDSMRSRQIPCDGLILDLYWFNSMGDLSWNPAVFPNHNQMVADFLARGIKTINITEPYVVQGSSNFGAGTASGYFGKNYSGSTYLISNWWSCGCNAALVDITNPASRAWWWNLYTGYLSSGVAGFWTDLGEPESHPADMVHYLGSTNKVHNIFNLLWAKTLFEGFHSLRPNDRIFNLTRAGFAGIQRYGVTAWSGDVAKSFRALSVQVPMLLTMGLSGIAYHNSDIGGFCCGQRSGELYTRWMQFGAFNPMMRAHGAETFTEPWTYGHPYEDICRKFIDLRYQLLPYTYSLCWQNYCAGMPLARPLFFIDPVDSRLANESSSYLWGDAFLVKPIVQSGQTTATVYLPSAEGDGWIDYWNDASGYDGNSTITVPLSLEAIPLFVREGSIIPMQAVSEYSDQKPLDTLFLELYPRRSAGAFSTFTMYEDDGKTLAYQQGSYALIPMKLRVRDAGAVPSSSSLEMVIGPGSGGFAEQPAHRSYIARMHRIVHQPSSVSINDQKILSRASYNELLASGGDGFYYDGEANALFVFTTAAPLAQVSIVAESTEVSGLTGVAEPEGPEDFRLEQNYPNPFNPHTVIRYTLPTGAWVTLRIYDQLGRTASTLVKGQKSPGSYEAVWDAGNAASGQYYYRLDVDEGKTRFTQTRKLLLVR